MRLADWLFFFLLSFIGGIALRSFWAVPWLFFVNLFFVFLAIAGLSFLIHKKPLKIFLPLAFVSFFLALGILRMESAIFAKDGLSTLRDKNEVALLNGIIRGEPDLRSDHVKYTVVAENYDEKILVSAPLFPKFGTGDKIQLKGKLESPAELSDFNYKDYLLKDGVRTVSYYPEIKLIENKKFSFLGGILEIKEKLRETNKKILPFPQNEILTAMILGNAQLIPENIKDDFSKVGIIHILSISGMHISIIIGVLAGILSKSGLSRSTFLIVSIFLIFYVVLVGLPASAIRAGIMGSVLLLAGKAKREYSAERALTLAAFLMLALNPMLLRYDIGFELSFLAVLGIITTTSFFEKILKFLKFDWLKKAAAVTLAAQVFTLPILVYDFGIFSTVSPLANMLVVPLLPFIMFGGFIAMLGGLISEWLGIFLAFPTYLIIKYTTWLSEFLANSPWSFQTISNLHIFWVIFYYILLLPVAFWVKKNPLAKFRFSPKVDISNQKG